MSLPPGGLLALLGGMAAAGSGERVQIGEITAALGRAGLGGAILVPALIPLSPATVVFGVATVCGVTIAPVALQIMCDARKLWLPGPACRIGVSRSALLWLERTLGPAFAWLEGRTRPRWTWLMRPPAGHVPGAVSFGVGAAMPFLELVPLSSTTGGAAVTLMVLGLLLDEVPLHPRPRSFGRRRDPGCHPLRAAAARGRGAARQLAHRVAQADGRYGAASEHLLGRLALYGGSADCRPHAEASPPSPRVSPPWSPNPTASGTCRSLRNSGHSRREPSGIRITEATRPISGWRTFSPPSCW